MAKLIIIIILFLISIIGSFIVGFNKGVETGQILQRNLDIQALKTLEPYRNTDIVLDCEEVILKGGYPFKD